MKSTKYLQKSIRRYSLRCSTFSICYPNLTYLHCYPWDWHWNQKSYGFFLDSVIMAKTRQIIQFYRRLQLSCSLCGTTFGSDLVIRTQFALEKKPKIYINLATFWIFHKPSCYLTKKKVSFPSSQRFHLHRGAMRLHY